MNAQANQRIDTMEGTLNKKIGNLQTEISQKYEKHVVFNLKVNQPAAGAGKGEISISDRNES